MNLPSFWINLALDVLWWIVGKVRWCHVLFHAFLTCWCHVFVVLWGCRVLWVLCYVVGLLCCGVVMFCGCCVVLWGCHVVGLLCSVVVMSCRVSVMSCRCCVGIVSLLCHMVVTVHCNKLFSNKNSRGMTTIHRRMWSVQYPMTQTALYKVVSHGCTVSLCTEHGPVTILCATAWRQQPCDRCTALYGYQAQVALSRNSLHKIMLRSVYIWILYSDLIPYSCVTVLWSGCTGGDLSVTLWPLWHTVIYCTVLYST